MPSEIPGPGKGKKKRKHSRGAHFRCVIATLQLTGQTLVERQQADLGRGVGGVAGHGHESGHAGDIDDVAVVLLDHGRQELLGHLERREQVNGQRGLEDRVALVEDRLAGPQPCVVDQDRRRADFAADLCGDGLDGAAGRHVQLVEVVRVVWRRGAGLGIGRRRRWWRDVQIHDRDAPSGELLHHLGADAAAAAGDEHDLSAPVPGLVAHVVVQGQVLEVLVGAVEHSDGEESCENRSERGDVDADGVFGQYLREVLLCLLWVSHDGGQENGWDEWLQQDAAQR